MNHLHDFFKKFLNFSILFSIGIFSATVYKKKMFYTNIKRNRDLHLNPWMKSKIWYRISQFFSVKMLVKTKSWKKNWKLSQNFLYAIGSTDNLELTIFVVIHLERSPYPFEKPGWNKHREKGLAYVLLSPCQ